MQTISYEDSLRKRMKDPEFKKAWEDLANEPIDEEPITLAERFWDFVANVQVTVSKVLHI